MVRYLAENNVQSRRGSKGLTGLDTVLMKHFQVSGNMCF